MRNGDIKKEEDYTLVKKEMKTPKQFKLNAQCCHKMADAPETRDFKKCLPQPSVNRRACVWVCVFSRVLPCACDNKMCLICTCKHGNDNWRRGGGGTSDIAASEFWNIPRSLFSVFFFIFSSLFLAQFATIRTLQSMQNFMELFMYMCV